MTVKIKHNKAHVLYKALGYDHWEYFISLLNRSLKSGGPSRPVECKARWPGDQIRWPRTNGPVLAPCLQNVTLLLYGVGVGVVYKKVMICLIYIIGRLPNPSIRKTINLYIQHNIACQPQIASLITCLNMNPVTS